MNRTVSNIQNNNNLRLKTHSDTLAIYRQTTKRHKTLILVLLSMYLFFSLYDIYITLYIYLALINFSRCYKIHMF